MTNSKFIFCVHQGEPIFCGVWSGLIWQAIFFKTGTTKGSIPGLGPKNHATGDDILTKKNLYFTFGEISPKKGKIGLLLAYMTVDFSHINNRHLNLEILYLHLNQNQNKERTFFVTKNLNFYNLHKKINVLIPIMTFKKYKAFTTLSFLVLFRNLNLEQTALNIKKHRL